MSYCEQLYGEIDEIVILLEIIIKYVNPTEYIFDDFGSGYGKIVNYYSYYFIKSIGVELVKERYDKALLYKENNNTIFINDNFFNIILPKNYVLLINNIAFKEGTNKRLSLKILNENRAYNLVLVTQKLPLLKKYYLNYFKLACSWGQSEIYIYIL